MEKRINIILTEEQLGRLEDIVSVTGLSKSEIIRRAFDDFYLKYCQEREPMETLRKVREKWRARIQEGAEQDPSGYDLKIVKKPKHMKDGYFMIFADGSKEGHIAKKVDISDDIVLIAYSTIPGEGEISVRWDKINAIEFAYGRTR